MALAAQLQAMARSWGKTPWEVANDPHFAFNATCWRVAQHHRKMVLGIRAGLGDPLSAALESIHEDL